MFSKWTLRARGVTALRKRAPASSVSGANRAAVGARRRRRKFSLVPNVMDEHGFAHLGGVTCEILYAACAR